MDEMPSTLLADYRTPTYTEENTPEGLLTEHLNEQGAWSMIHVLEGALELYCEDKLPGTAQRLARRSPGIVEPNERHRIALCGPVRFYVQYFKDPNVES